MGSGHRLCGGLNECQPFVGFCDWDADNLCGRDLVRQSLMRSDEIVVQAQPRDDGRVFFLMLRYTFSLWRSVAPLKEAIRCLKKEDSAILDCLRIYHNFMRPHPGRSGQMTHADAASIQIEGTNECGHLYRLQQSLQTDHPFLFQS